jgi:RNA polymerase sigma factor (sigma-70 family)
MPDRQLDDQFARFVRTGDVDALEFVFTRCQHRLHRCARRWLRDARAAEDLVQELFLALLVHGGTFEAGRPCLPYLIGALHRRAATWRLQQVRRTRLHASAGARVAERSALDAAVARELVTAVQRVLARLPGPSRDVLLRFVERHEAPADIARALGRPVGTVRVQLHRGLRQLRDELPKGFFALPLLLLLRPASAAPPAAAPFAAPARWAIAVAAAAGVVLVGAAAFAPPAGPQRAAAIVQIGPVLANGGIAALAAGAPLRAEPAPPRGAPAAAATVHVRHADGTPAAGVVVRVARAGHDADFGAAVGRTGDDGVAAFAALPEGELCAATDRGVTGALRVATGTAAHCTLQLARGTDVRVLVLDERGEPAPGAAIWLAAAPDQPWEGHVVAHADAAGACTLRALAAGSTFGALAPGRVPSPMRAVDPLAPQPAVLRLGGAAASVGGTVVDERGEPVEGAVVRVARHARAQFVLPGGDRHLELHPAVAVRTGADGAFACGELPPGRLEVSVRSPRHAAALVAVHAAAASSQQVRIVVRPGATVHGVVRGTDGAPIAGANVVAHGPARHQWAGTGTAADGSFTLRGLDPARAVLTAEADGHRRAELALRVTLDGPVGPVELELAPLARCHGRLLDERGEPLADAGAWRLGARAVRAAGSDGADAAASPQPIALASDGAFACAAEGALEFFCRPADDAVWQRCECRDGGDGGVDLRLPADHGVRGALCVRLQGATAAQRADAQVVLVRDGEVYRGRRDDADGNALLCVDLPAGDYTVHVRGRNGVCPGLDAGRVHVGSDGVTVDVAMAPHGTLAYRLEGTARGERVERCTAFVVDARGVQFALGGPAGRTALVAGRYTLWAHGLSFMTVRAVPFEVRDGEVTELCVPLRTGLVRHVAFRLPDGVHATDAHATIECRGACIAGDEPGLTERGFDTTADGLGVVALLLADDTYVLRLRAGDRCFTGTFAIAGEDGVAAPVTVGLLDATNGG